MKYTTQGDVRGSCGHVHRSIATAVKCLQAEQRDCEKANGYSDRKVVRCDGEPLTDTELDEMLEEQNQR